MKKKVIITLIVLLCVAGLGTLGVVMYKKHAKNSNPVDVYSVENYVGNWYEDYQSMDGNIVSNDDQSVYVGTDQVVKELLVQEGETVHVGDVLLQYDTTLLELQLETQKTQIEVYKTNISIAERELEEIKKITPQEPATEAPATEAPVILATDTDADMEDAPYEDLDPDDFEITYTKEEIAQMITSKETEIRDTKLQLQMAELQLQRQEKEVNEGTVLARMDGTVQTADISEETIANGKPVVVISGDDSYSAQVTVDEWSLSEMEVGTEVSVYSYETSNSYVGIVTEISNIPSDSYSYSSVTASDYPITIAIQDGEDLSEGMWVEVTMDGQSSYMMGNNDEIVLPLALVREENGNYYVMKQDGDRLKKQYVKTGKIYYGSEIVVKAGLDAEDYIAFPYGKDAVEGKKCQISDDIYY
jgi:multidrug efflux pump subunit AcrA (membrane-fusion protein)